MNFCVAKLVFIDIAFVVVVVDLVCLDKVQAVKPTIHGACCKNQGLFYNQKSQGSLIFYCVACDSKSFVLPQISSLMF